MHRRPSLTALIAATGVSSLVACVPAVGPSLVPGAVASPSPSVQTPVLAPAGNPGATPSATASGLPLPDPVLATGGKAEVSGQVFDETGTTVGGATVVATVRGNDRFANGSDSQTTTSDATKAGLYILSGCPTGTVLTVTATKPGWTTRTQAFVPTNLVGPGQNVLDFGGKAKADYALSDAPEVTEVKVPGDPAGIDPAATVTLRFSEPVIPGGLDKAFAIYAAGPATTGDAAVWQFASGGGLPVGYDTPTDSVTAPDKPIWDLRAFQATWRETGREVLLQFKPGIRFPADRNARIGYAVVLKGPISDGAGNVRSGAMLRLNQDGGRRNGYAFSAMTDRTPPRVVSVTATDVGNEKPPALPKDRIRITFSKPIVYQPLSLAKGASYLPDGTDTRSALYWANYRYIASAAFPEVFPFQASEVIGVRLLEGNTIVEIAPEAESDFTRGSTVYVQLAGGVVDPAGNPIDTSGAGNVGSAVAQ